MDGDGFEFRPDLDPVELRWEPAPPPRRPTGWKRVRREIEGWLTFLSGAVLIAVLAWADMQRLISP